MQLDSSLFVKTEENESLNVKAYADLEVRKAEQTYLNVRDARLTLTPTTSENATEYATFSTMLDGIVKNIKNQNIMLDSATTADAEEFTQAFQQGLQLVQGVSKTPIIKFYSLKDGKLWGMLTPSACEILPMMTNNSDCINMVYDLMIASNGQGYLSLSRENAQYTLRVEPTALIHLPEINTLQGMNITRTNQSIQNLYMPLGKKQEGYISYDNGYRKGNYADDEGIFTISTTDKTYNTKVTKAEITALQENMRIVATWEQNPPFPNGTTVKAKLEMFQDDKQALSLSINHQQVAQYVGSISILDPMQYLPIEQLEPLFLGTFLPLL